MMCRRRAITLGDHNAGVDGKTEIDEAATVARTAATGVLITAKVGDDKEQCARGQLRPKRKGTAAYDER